jgi:alginate O-acetyltransferase complex protein AlgI
MVFSSFVFIYLFLPLLLAGYYVVPTALKNLVLLLASLLFYFWGAPYVVFLLLVLSLSDIVISNQFGRESKKWWLSLGILLNLSALAYFKYANFFVDQCNAVLMGLGFSTITWIDIVLPAGISFFTFEKISYLVDVYTGKAKPAKKVADYVLFVSLFPHLIAGPILKYHDLADQIVARTHSFEKFFKGWTRFALGLSKKVLVADEMGRVADNIFRLSSQDLTTPYAWLGIIAYAFQIYFDFSGYSDMAIGLARMFGFNFIENFNHPYTATSITDFWKRWHISLTNWMREYLYFPLGGNLLGELKTYRNLVTVFFVSGLWHGASWNFVLWGLYHGFWLVIERVWLLSRLERLPRFLSTAFAFVVVLMGWVLFRSKDLPSAIAMYGSLFDPSKLSIHLPSTLLMDIIHSRGQVIFVVAVLCSFVPASVIYQRWSSALMLKISPSIKTVCVGIFSLLGMLLSTMAIADGTFSPFLYFRF